MPSAREGHNFTPENGKIDYTQRRALLLMLEKTNAGTPVRFIIRRGILCNKGMPSNYPYLMDFPAGYKPFIFEIP